MARFSWSGFDWSHSTGGAGRPLSVWSDSNSARLITKADGSPITGGNITGDIRVRCERRSDGNYNASQIITSKADFGYGNYEVGIRNRLDQYPGRIVVGVFLYKGNPLHEIDMEPSRWGGNRTNMSYAVHGPGVNRHTYRWNIDDRAPTRHRFTWTPRPGGSRIEWVVLNPDGSEVPNSRSSYNWDQTPVPGQQFMLELWATPQGSGDWQGTQFVDYCYFHHWPVGGRQPDLPAGFGSSSSTPTPTPTSPTGNEVRIGNASRAIDGVNERRNTDYLVVYTRDGGQTSSPANEWGTEAAVVDGRIVEMRQRETGMRIPDNGVVISAHGASESWLLQNARVGTSVQLPAALSPEPPAPPPEPPEPSQPSTPTGTVEDRLSAVESRLAALEARIR